ncbi:hypothetical protein H2248_007100 [Termitomyces sp. 'cryptogamus']|nr:hypothetical protein H2248_007100 [Termitomyces sp. 'cryptogamus']
MEFQDPNAPRKLLPTFLKQTWPWRTTVNATFPKDAVTTFTQRTHGVNIAEALKSEALAWQ